jgi:triosephosphate isomerase (TIM)
MSKQPIIIGNWKMYKTSSEAKHFLEELGPKIENCTAAVGLAVPYTAIETCAKQAKKFNILVGAQNVNDAREGAFTGEIAASMVKEAGATFVLVGHSERRRIFHETDELVKAKLKRCLKENLDVVLCIGETIEERESNHEEVLERQLIQGLEGVSKDSLENIMVAYEPVWAIGTGKSATADIANETHAFCRKVLEKIFGKEGAAIPLLYGGSVKPDNAKTLLAEPDIDGLLVGGASLEVKSFSAIINA